MAWLLNLLSPFRLYLLAVVVLVGMGATWWVSSLLADRRELKIVKGELSSCITNQQITGEINAKLQKDRETIAAKLATLKRLQPNSSVSVAGQADPVGAGARPAGTNGTVTGTSDDFRDYAAKCATYRSERVELESFIDSVGGN